MFSLASVGAEPCRQNGPSDHRAADVDNGHNPGRTGIHRAEGVVVLNQIHEQRWVALPAAAAERVAALERENAQLHEALASRIVLEQAKGVLAERFQLGLSLAFELLRRSARSERRRIHELAAEVVGSPHLPVRVEALAAELAARDATPEVSRD